MAIDPTSSSKPNLSASGKKGKNIKNIKSNNNEENNHPKEVAKRKKCPGVRVVGGRIYDSENGKTCHQCRQKTTDFFALCKNQSNVKPCTMAYCHKCLLNRYGEKAEDVSALDDWSCPKCKNICNCSFCMKKRGHQPTGILAHTAKACGYSSVSAMLQVSGSITADHEKLVDDTGPSPRKRAAHEMDAVISSPRKLGKENSFTGKIDSNSGGSDSPSDSSVMKNAKKAKLEGSSKKNNDNGAREADVKNSVKRSILEGQGKKDIGNPSLDPAVFSDKKLLKNPKQGKLKGMQDNTFVRRISPRKHSQSKDTSNINSTGDAKGNALSESEILESKPIGHPEQNHEKKKQQNLKKVTLDPVNDGTLARRTSPRKHTQSKDTSNINDAGDAKGNALSESDILESKPIGHPKQNLDKKKQQNLKKDRLDPVNDWTLARRISPRKHTQSKDTGNISGTGDAKGNALSESEILESKPIGHPEQNHDKEKQQTSPTKLIQLNEAMKMKFFKLNASLLGKETDSLFPSMTENMTKLDDHGTQPRATGEYMEMNKYQTVPCFRINDDIAFPNGTEMTSIHDIDIPPEDIGKALQFLEFCAAFGKVLNVKKGQAEFVLNDLLHGRTSRRGKYSATVQFHIHLITIIQEEREGSVDVTSSNGKQQWIQALKECISESESVLKSLALDHLCKRADGYENLKSSEKLQILNVLCDEVLGTAKIRNWIDDQILEHSEKAKEQKEKVVGAKNKEKSLKQKVQDEIARAVIEKKGSFLSISEHEAIVAQIKCEAAQAHSELLESEGMLSKTNQAPDALRVESLYVGTDGRVYWRLKTLSNKSDLVVQDTGGGNTSMFNEKWYSFTEDEKEAIQKSINVFRSNMLRAQKFRKRSRSQINELAPKP